MRNLAWLVATIMVVAVAAAALNRPLAESRPLPKARKRERARPVHALPEPLAGFSYTGPLLGRWSTAICFTPIGLTYRSDGIVEYQHGFGEVASYATYEVDDTHYPPVVITTTQLKDGRLVKDYCIWKITAEGKLRSELIQSGRPIPTSFSKDPNPLLFSRSH